MEEGRSSTLPCHELGVITTLLQKNPGIGGSAPQRQYMVEDCKEGLLSYSDAINL